MLADALSRRPDYELAHVTTLSSPLEDLIRVEYPRDSQCMALLHALSNEEFTKTRTPLCRHGYALAYINIPSIVAAYAIARM